MIVTKRMRVRRNRVRRKNRKKMEETKSLRTEISRTEISRTELPVDIDFDEASRAWNQNKMHGGSTYVYCCGFIKPNGAACQGPPHHWRKKPKMRDWSYCSRHKEENDVD
jgi:hypothetical protein